MNIADIKMKVDDFKNELIVSRECCDTVDLSDEVLYLLSIIQQAEKALERVCTDPHTHRPSRDFAFEALKAIRGN